MLPTCTFQLTDDSSRLKVLLPGILPIVLSSVSNNGQTDRTGVDYVIMSRVHFCQSVVRSANCSLGKYYNITLKSSHSFGQLPSDKGPWQTTPLLYYIYYLQNASGV